MSIYQQQWSSTIKYEHIWPHNTTIYSHSNMSKGIYSFYTAVNPQSYTMIGKSSQNYTS